MVHFIFRAIVLAWTLSATLFAVQNPIGRPTIAPFISGDAFRAICDYCFDEVDSSLNPLTVKKGSSIFVKTDFLDLFFHHVHPHIPVPYILVTHNSDDSTPGSFAEYLDDEKIIVWFGQNYDGTGHPKMIPIPMGVANFCWEHGKVDWIRKMREQIPDKVHLAHMQFSIQTYPTERMFVQKRFQSVPFCYQTAKKPFHLYLFDLASSVFEIAPRGHALDTHRIWESLYVGTIPIVRTSSLDCLYEGLPILIIEDWSQVDEDFLQKTYLTFKNKEFHLEKIWINYWVDLIASYRASCNTQSCQKKSDMYSDLNLY